MSKYIYIAIMVIVMAYVSYTQFTISSLETKVESLTQSINVCSMNKITCEASLRTQNIKISENAADLERSERLLSEWEAKPEKVRYKTIYKEVIRDNNLTGGCDEIKDLINSTTAINLNQL